ncbi:unnamed protein product [Camellia sinensis]
MASKSYDKIANICDDLILQATSTSTACCLKKMSSDEAVETAKQLALQEGWLLMQCRKIIKGGTHVDYVTNQITNYVMSIVNKKNMNANLKAHAVKNHLWVFVNALIDNPAFDSQTKETLTIHQSNFGSKCELSQEFLKKVSKSGIVESLLSWANFKQSKDLKKIDGTKRQRITGNTKLEDANDAGGKSSDKCTLILTEGVSAKALAVKDKGRDDKSSVAIQDILQEESLADERKDFTIEDAELVLENSDVSDSVDCLPEMQPDSEDRDTDTSEVHPPTEASSSVVSGLSAGQNGIRQTNSLSVMDDSSSTCSTDSVPSVVMNGSYKGGKNQRGKATCDATGLANEVCILAPEPSRDAAQPNDASESCKAESKSDAVVHSLQDRIKKLEQHVVKNVRLTLSEDPALAMAFSVARRAAAVSLLLVNGTYMKTVRSYLDSTILQHQLQRLNDHGSLKGASKGRTGLMVSAYLVYSGMSAEEALQVYAHKRTTNNEGVSIPSQRRYVGYWENTLSIPRGVDHGPPSVNSPEPCSRELVRIRLYDTVNTGSVFFVVLELQEVPCQRYCPPVEVFKSCCREVKKECLTSLLL